MESELKDHEYCLRCGRRLKNVDARLIGYGKVCEQKMKTEIKKPLFFNLGIDKQYNKC